MRGALLALALMVGVAHARPARLVVTSGSCDHLAQDLGGAGEFVPEAVASVTVVEADLAASVTLDDGEGHVSGPRTIRADSCSELAREVGVVISIALPAITALPDPTPVADNSDALNNVLEVLKTKGAVPQASDAEVAGRFEVPPHHPVERTMAAVVGMSSASGMGLAVGVRWQWQQASLAGELAGSLPQSEALDHVSIQRVSAALVACHHAGDFGWCGLVRVGGDHGAGTNLMNSRSVFAPVLEFAPRVTWERAVTSTLAVQLQAELDIAATTTQFDIDHVAVWQTRRFAGLGGAGIVMRFP